MSLQVHTFMQIPDIFNKVDNQRIIHYKLFKIGNQSITRLHNDWQSVTYYHNEISRLKSVNHLMI